MCSLLAFTILTLCTSLGFAQGGNVRALLAAPRQMERAQASAEIPVRLVAGKLEVNARVAGLTRRFIFDTGSPTVLTRAFADELGLTIHGQNTGTDAAGQPVVTTIAIVPKLKIGGLVFTDLPVMIYDPQMQGASTAACLIDGGVLGSDLMPGSVWQIDLENAVIRVAATRGQLPDVPSGPGAPLHVFGFPYAPVIEWAVPGVLTDKALFDTGSPATLGVTPPAYDHLAKKKAARPDGVLHGHEGEAAGGLGPVADLTLFALTDVRIGGSTLPTVNAITRLHPPPVIGAGLLATHVVTLDYVEKRFFAHPRAKAANSPETMFACRWTDRGALVINVRRDSAAWLAGLRPGTLILQANDRSLRPADNPQPCDLAAWLIETLPRISPLSLMIEQDAETRRINLP